MDPRTFDVMVQQLAGTRTRRSVMAGSLLAVLGVGQAAFARNRHQSHTHGAKSQDAARNRGTVTAEAGLNVNEKCPKKKRGRKLSCNDCRTGYSVSYTNDKGKTVRKCACKPVGVACTAGTAADCCSGVCGEDGTCDTGTCAAVGVRCTANAQCCTGVCDVGGSTTSPIVVTDPPTGNKCSVCLTGGATCDPTSFLIQCCYSECTEVDLGAGLTNQCCSIPGETCTPVGSTATVPAPGTCCFGGLLCPVAGGVGTPNVCCTASGEITPALKTCGSGGNTGQGCCTGQCNVAEDVCCAPAGTDPTLSGGEPCTGPDPNLSCCSGNCSSTPGLCA